MEDKFVNKSDGWDTNRRMEMVRRFIMMVRNNVVVEKTTRMVDLGCGTGLVGLDFAQDVERLIMIDTSRAMIEKLNEKLQSLNISSRVEVVNGEMGQYSGSEVDVIVTFMAMHHVESIEGLIQDMYKSLANRGVVVVGDLCEEDGTFHSGERVAHDGFDPTKLAEKMMVGGFSSARFEVYDSVSKNGQEYPLFMMIATKDSLR